MPENDLRAKIADLEEVIETKDRQIYEYFDRIEHLEDTIIKLETLIPEDNIKSSGKKKQKMRESKLILELEQKENQIRELKNRMGFLRKEKTQLQRKLEKYTNKKESKSTVIRIEEKREPLEKLVKDLQDKIRQKNLLITKLEEKVKTDDIGDLKNKLIQNESNFENLKKMMHFKDKIINELLNQMQTHKSLITDPEVQSKIKTIQELNEKISKAL